MNKIILLASVVVLVTSSCAKDYKCECVQTYTSNGVVTNNVASMSRNITSISKSAATSSCKMSESSYSSGGETVETKCELK